jgi:hypothetical protein
MGYQETAVVVVGEVSICLLQILLDMEKLMSEEEMGQEQQEEEVLEAELVSIVGIDTVMEENSPIVVVTVAVVKF